jgi:N-glycosylase/DNA lyase
MSASEILIPVMDYDLAATLDSGQAFRWQQVDGVWRGVIGQRGVRLRLTTGGIHAMTATGNADWQWLTHYLQSHVDLAGIVETFPEDAPMQAALAACRGLRLLRQEPWECLASFMLSSTKQIVQIRQIIALLCARHGTPIETPPGDAPLFSFPTSGQIARLDEAQLRACKMGFRAPNVLAAARQIEEGRVDLERVRGLPLAEARAELMQLRGVGIKIADCVLLFAYGFHTAFPVDVWIKKALQGLYFPRRRASEKRLLHFASTHFGAHGGYAQQYLFHYMRTQQAPRQAEAGRRRT